MASSTTNLDLTLPVGGENVSRQIINANNVKIDEAVGPVPSGTNLQSQVTALNNKLTRTLLTTATDLNTLIALSTGNVYYSGNDLSIHSNIPSGSWSNRPFDLDSVILGNGYTAQILRVYDSAVGPRIYIRQNYYTSSTPFPFTPWQELTLNKTTASMGFYDNRAKNASTGDNAQVAKRGNVVTISGYIEYLITPTSGQTSVLTLTADYRPTRNEYAVCIRESDGKPFVLQVASTGNVNIFNRGEVSSGNKFYIGISYVV